MASTLVFPPAFRVTDTAGDPVSGAQIRFFEAGTSTPKTVYSNAGLTQSLGTIVYTRSDGLPVASSGSNTVVLIYTGEDAYAFDILDADDVTLYPLQDDIVGAPALQAAEQDAPFVPVVTTGSNATLGVSDRGKLYNCTSNTITLGTPATLGDGWFAHIKNGHTSGRVTIAASAGISWQGLSVTTMLLEPGQTVSIACDGTAFRVFADSIIYSPAGFRPNSPGVIIAADRITTEPAASPGTRYIVSTGFDSYATGDILTDDGDGGFVATTPENGWIAYVDDEDLFYVHKDGAWTTRLNPLDSLDMPAGTVVDRAYAEYTTSTSLSTAIPFDDTIPQNDEGTEIITAAITPKKSTNRIRATFTCQATSTATAAFAIAALFRNSTADALRATFALAFQTDSESNIIPRPNLMLIYEDSPGSTDEQTYKIRVGPNASETIRLNGELNGRVFGGTMAAVLVLEEIQT